MNFPSEFFAGDTLTWKDAQTKDSLGNVIQSSTWTLTYALRGAVNVTLTASADGTGWQTTASSTQTASLNTGLANVTIYWQAYVTNGSNRITLGSGQSTCKPNLTLMTAGYDGRTQAQKDLDAVTAEITARLNGGASIEYTIVTRSLKKEPMSSLLQIQNRLKYLVMKEQRAADIANGLGDPRAVFVRF